MLGARACSTKDPLCEEIEVVPPLGRVVRVAIDMPDVRNVLALEIGMHALADADQAVPLAAGDPEQFQLLPVLAGSGTSCAAGFVLGAAEKAPTQAKVSRCARPKFSDWPPPMDRPASARCSRSACTE